MKAEIHPDYINCEVACACGAKFMTRSTKPSIHLEICGACHPFYTGKQKFVDTAGRIQRFQEKFRWDQDAAAKTVAAKPAKPKKEAPAEE